MRAVDPIFFVHKVFPWLNGDFRLVPLTRQLKPSNCIKAVVIRFWTPGWFSKGGLISEGKYFDFGPIANKRCQINLLSRKFEYVVNFLVMKFQKHLSWWQNIRETKDTRLQKGVHYLWNGFCCIYNSTYLLALMD